MQTEAKNQGLLMGKAIHECIEYAGGKYYKNPRGYYVTSRCKGAKLLHVQLYQDYWKCIIPKGFVVHHKDGNNENNTIDNYFLMTRAGHCRLHQKGNQNQLGKKASEETKEKLRRTKVGKKASDETKEKMRIAMLGRTASEETKEKIRIAKLGTEHSEETKEKMRVALLGKRRIGKYVSVTIKG